MSLPDHDDDEDLGDREDFFVLLADRMDGKQYLYIRNHFDQHMEKDGVEAAYLCLFKNFVHYMESVNRDAQILYNVFTGDSLGDTPTDPEGSET